MDGTMRGVSPAWPLSGLLLVLLVLWAPACARHPSSPAPLAPAPSGSTAATTTALPAVPTTEALPGRQEPARRGDPSPGGRQDTRRDDSAERAQDADAPRAQEMQAPQGLVGVIARESQAARVQATAAPAPPAARPAGPATVAVFYGTDRRPTGQSAPASFFGGLRGDATPHLGICHVSIPPSHEVGRIETPFIASVPLLGAYAREDPARHVVITGLTHLSRAGFGHHLRQRLQVTSGDAFVFVHGYNNTFADACKRTAQIAHDLEFRGVPVMYSWPSLGKATAYAVDDGNADWSLPHFEAFLTMIQRDTGARHVHLVAHSTGSRLLARALHALARTTAWGPGAFQQVVLAAADVDAAEFRDQYAPSIRALASRLTLYVSSADKALLAATRLRKYPRAGEAGENLLVMDGVDTIDVSPVDTSLLGHSYIGIKPVFQDLLYLLRAQSAPLERCRLSPACYLEVLKWRNGLDYWRFRPRAP